MGGLVKEARALVGRGVRELILIGQDIARFGADRQTPDGLIRLLDQLAEIPGLDWIRLMYVHPDHLSDQLINKMASEQKILSYLDLPVQHVSDTILTRMNRPGSSAKIRDRIARLRDKVSDLVLRSSLIVGFPGEREKDFQELRSFVEEVRFDHLGVFTYSREEDTPAAGYPDQVSNSIKTDRKKAIMALQNTISKEKNRMRVGTTLQVLVEGPSPETDLLLAGRFYGQAPEVDGLVLINKGNAVIGEFHDVLITDAHDYDLVGEIVDHRHRRRVEKVKRGDPHHAQ